MRYATIVLRAKLLILCLLSASAAGDEPIKVLEISERLGADLQSEDAADMPAELVPEILQVSFVDGDLPPSQQLEIDQEPPAGDGELTGSWFDTLDYSISAYARGAFNYDNRIWFTGQASDFNAEGGLYTYVQTTESDWTTRLDAELYLNQPFDRNRLVDTPTRTSFDRNFDVDILEISQLVLSARRDDFMFAIGKMVTPFGRFYFPLFTNRLDDAPFIRSEAIRWRETGLLLQYDPSIFVGTVALTNGGFDRDANSTKALVARIGLQEENWAVGSSIKWQDGIGSEHQKERNNHVGMDAMVKNGNWILSGEVIYDEYGLRKGDLTPDDIHWGRSLYNRQLLNPDGSPLHGVGYYLDLGYVGESWQAHLNYGEYYPSAIGDHVHDAVSRRGIIKFAYNLTSNFSSYTMMMLENTVDNAFDGHDRRGIYFLTGFQATL